MSNRHYTNTVRGEGIAFPPQIQNTAISNSSIIHQNSSFHQNSHLDNLSYPHHHHRRSTLHSRPQQQQQLHYNSKQQDIQYNQSTNHNNPHHHKLSNSHFNEPSTHYRDRSQSKVNRRKTIGIGNGDKRQNNINGSFMGDPNGVENENQPAINDLRFNKLQGNGGGDDDGGLYAGKSFSKKMPLSQAFSGHLNNNNINKYIVNGSDTKQRNTIVSHNQNSNGNDDNGNKGNEGALYTWELKKQGLSASPSIKGKSQRKKVNENLTNTNAPPYNYSKNNKNSHNLDHNNNQINGAFFYHNNCNNNSTNRINYNTNDKININDQSNATTNHYEFLQKNNTNIPISSQQIILENQNSRNNIANIAQNNGFNNDSLFQNLTQPNHGNETLKEVLIGNNQQENFSSNTNRQNYSFKHIPLSPQLSKNHSTDHSNHSSSNHHNQHASINPTHLSHHPQNPSRIEEFETDIHSNLPFIEPIPSQNPNVKYPPINQQSHADQQPLQANNTSFMKTYNTTNILPPRYEDVLDDEKNSFQTFLPPQKHIFNNHVETLSKYSQPSHKQSLVTQDPPIHSRARSEIFKGRPRQLSESGTSNNKWSNLTVNTPRTPQDLLPIGVQSIETYLPRLTLQDNNTILKKTRSRSLVRNAMSERSVSQHSARKNVELAEERESDLSSWYIPAMNRNQAISHLHGKPPGSFVVRKSSSYSGLYTLVMVVESIGDDGLRVRKVSNFLIEVSPTGARLKGYQNEPEFVNLKALIDHHSKEALGLPCRLVFPLGRTRTKSKISFKDLQAILYLGGFSTDGFADYIAMKKVFKMCSVQKNKEYACEVDVNVTKEAVSVVKDGESFSFMLDTITHCEVDSHNKSRSRSFKDVYENIQNILFGFIVQASNHEVPQVHVFCTDAEKAHFLADQINQILKR